MKLIVELQNLNSIDQYRVDGLIFSDARFAALSHHCFQFDEIIQIIDFCQKHNILTILKIDKIIEEDEVELLYTFLDQIISFNIDYYIFTDMSILYYFKKKNELHRLIYSAKTLNCSLPDASFFQTLGIRVILSNELHLEDIIQIAQLNHIVLDVFGYMTIFYSKRKLISLFSEFEAFDTSYSNRFLSLVEETRSDQNPIYENHNGTFILTKQPYVLYRELPNVASIDMIRIESLFLEESTLIEIIEIYRNALVHGLNENDWQRLQSFVQDSQYSFLSKKSQVLGGETHEKN